MVMWCACGVFFVSSPGGGYSPGVVSTKKNFILPPFPSCPRGGAYLKKSVIRPPGARQRILRYMRTKEGRWYIKPTISCFQLERRSDHTPGERKTGTAVCRLTRVSTTSRRSPAIILDLRTLYPQAWVLTHTKATHAAWSPLQHF